MSLSDHVAKWIASLSHIPPETIDYFIAARHIGRGAETVLPFPAELIPVGARLVLRGWLNDAFFPTNRDWVLPYWAEHQFDPNDPAFMPRALNLYTINYTHRDWTMIGNPGQVHEPIVDPRGLVTPWFDGWSLDVWLGIDGQLIAPSRLPDGQVEQALDENLPLVITRFHAMDFAIRIEAFSTVAEKDEWVVEEITVENKAGSARTATLYLSVRPFNPEGVSLVKSLSYCEQGEQAAFLVKNAPGVLMPKPNRVAVSDLQGGDVALAIPALNGCLAIQDPSGLVTGVVAYNIELDAGGSKSFTVRLPMVKAERDDEDTSFPDSPVLSFVQAREQVISDWRARMDRGMRVRLPDEHLQNAFDANKAYLLLFHDGNSITPGPLTYHQFWFRDAAFMLNALDKLGYHDESRQVLEQFPRRLEKDGYLRATEGEWDSDGAAIWAMVENARLSGDLGLLSREYWSILRMASWINSKRQQTKGKKKGKSIEYGLLPSGPSAEHLGPSNFYYWDDFWGLAGLRDAGQVATWLGQTKDAERLHANYASFRADVDASLAAAAERIGRAAMPASPDRRLDSGMIGSLAALYPLRLMAPDDPRIVDTLTALREKAWVHDTYYSEVGHSALGTYLSLHMAECYLLQRRPEAWSMIQWVLEHASCTHTWAEGINPITMHGGMGDGHHGWAAADYILAVRNMLLVEGQDHLVITPLLPTDWTEENNVIKVEDAATYFGKVSYTMAFGERTGTLVVYGDWHKRPAQIEWVLPFPVREAGGDIEGVEIKGNVVHLPQGANRVVAMW